MTFDPRYAIVTASDSGIGKATAVALADAGMDVGEPGRRLRLHAASRSAHGSSPVTVAG